MWMRHLFLKALRSEEVVILFTIAAIVNTFVLPPVDIIICFFEKSVCEIIAKKSHWSKERRI